MNPGVSPAATTAPTAVSALFPLFLFFIIKFSFKCQNLSNH